MQRVSSMIFTGLAQSYDRVLDYATLYQDRRWKSWVSRMMDGCKGDAVLDIGCGTLLLEERLARKGYNFVGLDLAPEMIRRGQRKGIPNVVLLANGDAEFLPFPAGSFDVVVSCYVPKYVDARRFAAEVARVARPGAKVVLYDFARPKGWWAPVLEVYIQGGLRLVGLLLELAGREESSTFTNLPRIIEETAWDDEIVDELEIRGFESIAKAKLTGGAVFAYCGRRRTT
jgi:demethylmenaquinone methyltransferase / 2-methoxy-6-polyprenyl-1,4-benzoquinol methylase